MGSLIQRYSELAPELEIIGYLGGYKGLLLGSSVPVTAEVRAGANVLHNTAAARSATAGSSSRTARIV